MKVINQFIKAKIPNLAFFKDIRVWILLLTLLHFENITAPPFDAHSWRQMLTLMVTRNMVEIDWNYRMP